MTARWIRWPAAHPLAGSGTSPDAGTARLGYGADYNPEQWPEAVWADDVRLMREAGVNIVSVGIFSWALLQPTPDTWDFGWLDRALDLLHAHGIAVDLATATASPPPWLTDRHPEILPVNRLGETVWPGGRQQWRPTSPVFRRYALALVEKLALRYAAHPALALWHVNNELGCHNAYDYSEDAATAFRTWLAARYGSLVELNRAWGTAFWSQNYSAWRQILPPRLAATHPNPTQQLDFDRFSSAALKAYLVAERDILRQVTPAVPVTTNFMVMGESKAIDYADWAPEVDVVSNDHYLQGANPLAVEELSFSANLTGRIAGRRPWVLMEHSTSAVNWQPVNLAKTPGQLRRDSLVHVAHGADAVCFFQWRQSLAGAEKFHSGMVPHAGEHSAVFREVVALGSELAGLAALAGSRPAAARIGILFDWESWWAAELDSHPTELLRYQPEAQAWYTAAFDNGLRADVVPLASVRGGGGVGADDYDLSAYDLVVAPMLYLVPEALGAALADYVRGGGHLVVGAFSGIADGDDHVYPGGYPGAFRELLGVRTEQFGPLLAGMPVTLDSVSLDSGSLDSGSLDGTLLPAGGSGSLLTGDVAVGPDVEVLARFVGGPFPGVPAVTRRRVGQGQAGHVATIPDRATLRRIVSRFATDAGITSALDPAVHGLVELATRESATEAFDFYINHGATPCVVRGVDGEALTASTAPALDHGTLRLAANDVAIVRRSPRSNG